MSQVIYYLLAIIIGALIVGLGIFFSKKSQASLSAFFKVASLVVGALFLFRYMWGADAIQEMVALANTPIASKFLNFMAIFLVWFSYASALLVSMYGFYAEYLNKFIKYFALPCSLVSLCVMPFHFTAILGAGAFGEFSFRGVIFALEIGAVFAYSLLVLILNTNLGNLFNKQPKQKQEKNEVVVHDGKSKFTAFMQKAWQKIKHFFANYWFGIFSWIVIIISVMPAYTMQGLFGFLHTSATCKGFELPHRIILYIGLILPIVVHYSLRQKEYRLKRFYLLYICLGTLLTFSLNHKFATFLDPVNWPLHLCNTAMYIMPIVLLFNMKKFFYFTYFINVIGALFAMFMPNYDATTNMFATNIIVFYVNHYIAFFMPVLFVSLGMFEKPKFKQFVYSMLGFLAYFVLVLILNAMFTGMFEAGLASAKTDFFFINSDFIADKLGTWCKRLMDVTAVIQIGGINLTFYPVYQVLFFVVYIGIGLAMWFVYEQGYEISYAMQDRSQRRQKIKLERLALEIKTSGRSVLEPMEPEFSNQLVLKDFSKKYANSKVYAVENANLQVNGGEIFGFLGPNGAGKSTIIKTIVGIQPITSGDIYVCGYDIKTQSVEAKKQVGYVPDHYALYEKLTGREYINYIADLYNVSLQDRTQRINSYLERFELTNAFDNQMKTYSHGMKQKIAIMSALVHNPKVWILDEPLTGLDPNSIYQVKECMKEHAKAGNIVFFSSHIIDVVERICDRIAIIKNGKILTTKSVKEIEQSGTTLEQFYMNTIGQNIENN